MTTPAPTPTDNAASIATLSGKIDGLVSDVKRVEGDLQFKDNNLWGTVNRIQEEVNKHGRVNWPLIVSLFTAITGALVTIIGGVVLYTQNTFAPLSARLIDHEGRIEKTWQAQARLTDRITADEIAAAYRNGRQDEINGRNSQVKAGP